MDPPIPHIHEWGENDVENVPMHLSLLKMEKWMMRRRRKKRRGQYHDIQRWRA